MAGSTQQQEHRIRITQVFRAERQIVISVRAPDVETAVETQSGDEAPAHDDPRWKESSRTLENEAVEPA
jgi:hypothetical protein